MYSSTTSLLMCVLSHLRLLLCEAAGHMFYLALLHGCTVFSMYRYIWTHVLALVFSVRGVWQKSQPYNTNKYYHMDYITTYGWMTDTKHNSVQIRCWTTTSLQNSFSAPWHRSCNSTCWWTLLFKTYSVISCWWWWRLHFRLLEQHSGA